MIYTVTLNPAIDYYLEMDDFTQGDLNHLNNGYTLPGGKGINVSKVLKNFKVPSTALGFVGGFTGTYIKKNVLEYGIDEKFINIQEDTRINIKMKTKAKESEIAGMSPNISKIEYDKFLKTIKLVRENDVLVLSGSVPSSLNKDIYKKIIDVLPENVKVILDTRGEPLHLAMCNKVFLVKPNKDEIEEFFQEKYNSEDELIEAGKKLRELGATNVIISLGKNGSILISPEGVFRGNVPKGKLISSVGAGDSMVSGFLYGLYSNKSIVETYKYAIASGSSTAFSKGLTTFENMNNLLNSIEVTKI